MSNLTIGLPVYNREHLVGESIESLLNQTFTDFRLLIADNASTDQTGDICRQYASSDERVSYFRHDRNLGAADNYNCLARLAASPYFKWASSDDLCAPTMLERSVEVLDSDPKAIGAFTRIQQVDESGSPIKVEPPRLRSDSPHAHIRFRHVIAMPHSCFSIFGIYRTKVLQHSALIQRYVGSDRTLLAELALMGPSIQIPEALLARRVHSDSYCVLGPKDPKAYGFWTAADDPTMNRRQLYRRLVETCPALDDRERSRCYREVEISYRMGQLLDLAIKRTATVRRRLVGLQRPKPAPHTW